MLVCIPGFKGSTFRIIKKGLQEGNITLGPKSITGQPFTVLELLRIVYTLNYLCLLQKLKTINWKKDPSGREPTIKQLAFRKAIWLTGIGVSYFLVILISILIDIILFILIKQNFFKVSRFHYFFNISSQIHCVYLKYLIDNIAIIFF